ncbi:MAG: YnbE family lipoprotein [Alphaproteobacteria bacterium]|nr:YnbE family lipoprotein [Alphaproteobacteria bacterium]MDE2340098.1 YnbE family lipoprotein [Alphaproteobacteria bacterium]
MTYRQAKVVTERCTRVYARYFPTRAVALAILALGLNGCVQLAAPEKPIQIDLNITIKQEVVVKLQKDAQDTITNNPELFPK